MNDAFTGPTPSTPPPLTTEEALKGQRADVAKVLRRLAEQAEAGRLPMFGGAWTELCGDCDAEHPMTLSYTEDQRTTAYLTLGGMIDMLMDGIRTTIKSMAFHDMIHRARAQAEATQATKQ